MNKYLIIISVLLTTLVSCTDLNKKSVEYVATGSISAYNLQYLDDKNELVDVKIVPQSAQDSWTYGYFADEGDILYISGNYKDINSSLKLMILVNGKVYKLASNSSDTTKYLTVSGTVPYDD